MSSAPAPATSSTPILDRLAPLPAPESQVPQWIRALLWVGVIVMVTVIYQTWHPPLLKAALDWLGRLVAAMAPTGFGEFSLPVLLIALVVAFYVTVLIHELGHVLAGLCAGFRFNQLRFGPLQIDRPFRLSRYRGRGTGAGGWASMFPENQDRLVVRAIVMLLGGPGINLLTVAVFAWLRPKGILAAQVTYFSLLFGVMNMLPFRSRAMYSDGWRVLMLLANRARGERWLAMLRLVDELRRGVPPQEMSQEFLAKAVALEDKSPDTVTAHAILYSVAYWTRKDEEAAQALETCLRHSALTSPRMRQGLINDAVVFQSRRRKRVDLAEQWQAELPAKPESPWTRPWGEAAILEAKGELENMRKKLEEIEAIVRSTPNEAVRIVLTNSLQRWRGELGA